MVGGEGPPIDVASDHVTSTLLALDQTVMMRLARAFVIAWVDEQLPVSFEGNAMVHDRCLGYELILQASLAKRLVRQLSGTGSLPYF